MRGLGRRYVCALLCGLLMPVVSAVAEVVPDAKLLAVIQKIEAIDNHSHALPARTPQPAEANSIDPLGASAFSYPVRLRVTNLEYIEAWRALYGYKHSDMTRDHVREAVSAKLRLMTEKGTDFPAWVLNKAGIRVMLVNMPSLGPGQTGPRFLWVPAADGLLFPFASEEEPIKMFRTEVGLETAPAALDEFLDDVVKKQLERWKGAGAVAIKFAVAYVRSLDFTEVSAAAAKSIYERQARDGNSPKDYKLLQDFIFRFAAREAGRLGLAVHIHTGVGADPFFDIGGANPMLLESAFNDKTLRETNFVMIHGGWPFEREAGVMLMKPNVYADFSAQTFLRSTHALSGVLREWLEWYPEKVMFGTDAYSEDTPLANWEEKAWLGSRTSRMALAVALTEMMNAGQITRARAEELARLVLFDNAARLYRLERR